jgi:hypothetical protein
MVMQMNFIDQFFGTNSNVLSERLQASGFSAEQANNFLAEAASGILKAYQHKEIELIISALEMDDPAKLLSAVNLNAVANNIDMSADQTRVGFEVFAPVMAMAFKNHSGGIVDAAASIAWGSTGDFLNLATKQ